MKIPEWQYDENRHVGVDYADASEVSRYDARMATLRDFKAEVSQIVSAVRLSRDDVVLDIGTGTGEIAIGLAPFCKHVTAVDISSAMIDCARTKASNRGVTNVVFERDGFLSFGAAAGTFNVIVSQLALHHLPDFWKMRALVRVNTLLKAGGMFYLRDVVFPSQISDYDAYFAKVIRNIGEKTGNGFTAELIKHIKDEFSTLDWIMEGMIERAGFRVAEKKSDGILSTYVCRKILA